MNTKKFTFSRVTKEFHKTILDLFEEDHVKEFYYGQGLQNTLHNLELYCQGINNNGRYSFDLWLAFFANTAFGFLMTSPIVGPYAPVDAYNKWYIENKNTFTLDLLIGPKKFLGKGLAHKMIQAFILDKFSAANYFIIDPSQSNPKAIHVYEKAGFKKVDEFIPAYDPIPHLMMRLEVSNLKSMQILETNVKNVWGEKGEAWLNQLPAIIDLLSNHWSLRDVRLVKNMNYNYVALATQANNTPVVLKISCDEQLINDEYKALSYFAGHGAIKIFDRHKLHNALLLEQAIPGNLLKEHHPIKIEDTITLYADVVKSLATHPFSDNDFTPVARWCESIDRIKDPRVVAP